MTDTYFDNNFSQRISNTEDCKADNGEGVLHQVQVALETTQPTSGSVCPLQLHLNEDFE